RVWQFVRHRPIATLAPIFVAGALVGLYARNYYRGTPAPRSYWEAAMYCPYPDGWFVATPGSLWADHLTPRAVDDFSEKMLFQGFTIYAVLVAAGGHAWRREFPGRGLVLASLGTAAVLALLVTRFGGNVSIWFLIHQLVPGANAFRAVGRIAFDVYMFGTIGGLVGLQSLVNDKVRRPRARGIVFVAVAALMMLEQGRPNPESFDKRE